MGADECILGDLLGGQAVFGEAAGDEDAFQAGQAGCGLAGADGGFDVVVVGHCPVGEVGVAVAAVAVVVTVKRVQEPLFPRPR